MSHETESRDLMESLLAESAPAEFRAATLAATLGAVRRHRRHRRWRQGTGLVVLAMAGCLALWWPKPVSVPGPSVHAGKSVPSWVVRSQPVASELVVTSRRDSVPVVNSTFGDVPVIRTAVDGSPPKRLTDDELLDLVAGRAVALVRWNGRADLAFAPSALKPTER